MHRHIIMILALLLTPMLSLAHLKTARNLKTVCDAMHKSSQNAGQCNSYIHGVYDAIDGVMACPPTAATTLPPQAELRRRRVPPQQHSPPRLRPPPPASRAAARRPPGSRRRTP